MSDPGVDHPPVDSAADVTSLRRGLSVNARVATADPHAILVRPSVGDYVGQEIVAVGEEVEVFWQGPDGGRVLTATVSHVDYGAAPRWHLAVTGPAEARQRRTAVRCSLSLPVTLTIHGVELEGSSLDLSEAGARVMVEGYGVPPEPGQALGLTVQLGDEALWCRAEAVRLETRGNSWVMSLRFLGSEERDQDRLRRRVFQELREERARIAADRPGG